MKVLRAGVCGRAAGGKRGWIERMVSVVVSGRMRWGRRGASEGDGAGRGAGEGEGRGRLFRWRAIDRRGERIVPLGSLCLRHLSLAGNLLTLSIHTFWRRFSRHITSYPTRVARDPLVPPLLPALIMHAILHLAAWASPTEHNLRGAPRHSDV